LFEVFRMLDSSFAEIRAPDFGEREFPRRDVSKAFYPGIVEGHAPNLHGLAQKSLI
jgi:hypothetical protein